MIYGIEPEHRIQSPGTYDLPMTERSLSGTAALIERAIKKRMATEAHLASLSLEHQVDTEEPTQY